MTKAEGSDATPPAAASTGRPRARRTRPEDRHAQLLDVAEQLILDGGTDALRMDTLAQAAGVTRPVVYQHFGNRDGLIVALLQRYTVRITERDPTVNPAEATFEDVLRTRTRTFLEAALRNGVTLRILINSENLSPAIESARQLLWTAAANRWSTRYRSWYSLSAADAHALAARDLAALSVLGRLCADGQLTVDRAVELHVTTTLAALAAVSGTGPDVA
jgi:AcrR family transcriptional regulator